MTLTIDNTLILPPGTARIEAEETIQRNENTAGHLTENFGYITQDTYGSTITPDGMVLTSIPTRPYHKESRLVSVYPEWIRSQDPEEEISAILIGDLSRESQRTYYEHLFASLIYFHEQNRSAVAVENAVKIVGGRSSRSIAIPHAQILPATFEDSSFDPEQPYTPLAYLKFEQKLFSDKEFQQFIQGYLQGSLSTSMRDRNMPLREPEISWRSVPPHGYTLLFQEITHQTIQKYTTLEEITRFFALHAQVYKDIVDICFERANQQRHRPIENQAIKQPSFRAYYYFNTEGNFCLTVSPEIFSAAGVMEAAGVKIIRR